MDTSRICHIQVLLDKCIQIYSLDFLVPIFIPILYIFIEIARGSKIGSSGTSTYIFYFSLRSNKKIKERKKCLQREHTTFIQ